MTLANGALERLNQLERRIADSEADRRDIWRQQGILEKAQAVTDEQAKGTREDLNEIRNELRWVRRGMWAAAGFFAMLIIAVVQLGGVAP
jgi:hypothetical protein